MNKEIHECKYYKGKISDCTIRKDRTIRCRKCGGKLEHSQVEPKMLELIKSKFKRMGR